MRQPLRVIHIAKDRCEFGLGLALNVGIERHGKYKRNESGGGLGTRITMRSNDEAGILLFLRPLS